MGEGSSLSAIEPGMPVYGSNGESLGQVEAIDEGGIRVQNSAVPTEAIARIDRDGVHLHLAATVFATSEHRTNPAEVSGEANRVTADRIAIPKVEERLSVDTRPVQIGEAGVTKRVVEEQVMVPVTVRREEVEIIHRAPGETREEIDDPQVVEVIRIPLRGEEPVITTQAMITSEVVVSRTVQTEQGQITRSVRSSGVKVEEHLNEEYRRLRPAFEEHFTRRQQENRATSRARAFDDAEPHYRVGFLAGSDGRHIGRTFAEVEPELRPAMESAERDPGMMDQIREEVREGFARARATSRTNPH